MPERITNQYIQIRKSADYIGKSFFIVDTKENLIFLFDKNGNFVAKSPTIDGFNKQDKKYENEALKSWQNHAYELGFVWNFFKQSYVDVNGKNKVYSHNLVYNYLSQKKCRFFPKGIYKITNKYHHKDFIGKGNNTYGITTMDGKYLALAIHGLYKSEYRIHNMNQLISLIGSDFNQIKISSNYRNVVISNDNNGTYNNSFGCINVPEKFLEKSNNYAVNSLVFVLGESKNDYLVK